MCVPGKLVYLYVGPLPRRRKLYKNDVIYGGTALSGDDRNYLTALIPLVPSGCG